MNKLYCDFCEDEIQERSTLFQETFVFKNVRIGARVTLFNADEKTEEFPYDICRNCAFDAVDYLDPRPMDRDSYEEA